MGRSQRPGRPTPGEKPADAEETPGQQVVRPLDDPIKETGGLVILRGNLAPEGCVVKVAGYERKTHRVIAPSEAEETSARTSPSRPSRTWAR